MGLLAAWLLVLGSSSLFGQGIQDDRGRILEVSSRGKIVSGFVGADEIVFELLKDNPERILAFSPLAKDRKYSAIYDRIGAWSKEFGPELESLIGMKPDLVLVARYTRAEWIRILDHAKIKSFVLGNFSALEDIKDNILIIGRLLGKEKKARSMVESMNKEISTLKPKCFLKGKKVLNYSRDGIIFGKGTIFNSILNELEIENRGSDLGVVGWSKVSRETILKANPDYVIVGGNEEQRRKLLKEMKEQTGWKHLSAVQKGRVIIVPSRFLSSVSQYVVRGMEALCGQK